MAAALDPLFDRLYDADDEVRAAAAAALRSFPPSQALNAVRARLRERLDERGDGDVKRLVSTVDALGELRDTVVSAHIIDLLDHSDPLVVDAAGRALQAITKQDFGRSRYRWTGWWRRHQAEPRLQWLLAGLCHGSAMIRSSAQDELCEMSGTSAAIALIYRRASGKWRRSSGRSGGSGTATTWSSLAATFDGGGAYCEALLRKTTRPVARLATANSGRVSPVRSAAMSENGPAAAVKRSVEGKVPSPLPMSTLTVPSSKLATARSSLPSPLKSALASELGPLPTATDLASAKLPSPLPIRTLTLALAELALTRSSFMSPSRSREGETQRGRLDRGGLRHLEGAVAPCREQADAAAAVVGDAGSSFLSPLRISEGQRHRSAEAGQRLYRRRVEGAVALAGDQQDLAVGRGDQDIVFHIAIGIGNRQGGRRAGERGGLSALERAIALAEGGR